MALETLTPSGRSAGDSVIRIVPVQAAETPTQPVSPNWNRNLALGMLLGGMAGFGFVLLRHIFDRRVRQSADVEEITGAATLAVVPKADELVNSTSLARNMGAAAEALRQLRTSPHARVCRRGNFANSASSSSHPRGSSRTGVGDAAGSFAYSYRA